MFQTVRFLNYDRFATLEAIRGAATGDGPRPLQVAKLQPLAVHAAGVV